MPVKECQEGNKPGFKWGDEGKCYTYTEGDEAGKQEAHDKAAAQGAAIEANKNKESINSNMAIDIKNLTGKTQTREFTFKVSEESSINEDERTVNVKFSSDIPYERSGYIEVLDHSPDSVDLGRLNDGAAVLVNHDNSLHVGVVEKASIDSDNSGRAKIRFGRSNLAREIFEDVKDGIRRFLSVGYEINGAIEDGERNGVPLIRVNKWTPLEISLASIPADATAGVGRTKDTNNSVIEQGDIEMTVKNNEKTDQAKSDSPQIDTKALTNEIREKEVKRLTEINAMGRKFNKEDLAQKYIAEGRSVDSFREEILNQMGNGDTTVTPSTKDTKEDDSKIGMTARDMKNYSFLRAIRAVANPNDRRAQDAAGFERECSEEAAKKAENGPQGILIPYDMLTARRDLSVSVGSPALQDGGYLVGTEHRAGSFIEILRNASVAQRAGSTMLTGLRGDVAIPKQTGAATASWITTEGGDATESSPTFGQVTLNPKTLGTYTDITRQLMLQSDPSVEELVRTDLATVVALAIDKAVFYGTGTNGQPVGIANVSGIGTVNMGGSPFQNFDWGDIVDLETAIAVDNALVSNVSYVTNATVRGVLKKTEKASGTAVYIWEGGFDGELNGYRAYTSNQINAHHLFFGNFRDVLLGMWGGLDLTVDPYTHSTSGTVRIVVLQSVDVAVRRAQSFALAS